MPADPADSLPTPSAAPVRTLDDYLAHALPNLTKRERRRLVARGGVQINGAPAATVDTPLGPDDTVVLPPPPPPAAPASPDVSPAASAPRPEPRPLRRDKWLPGAVRIVHEDRDLLVVDKPPGMITADPTRAARETLFDILKGYARRRSGRRLPGAARVWVIHRLDKEASGLLVFAKSEKAFEWLKEDFRARRVQRLYYALAEGVVGPPGHSATHQSFLQEDAAGNVRSLKPAEFRGRPGEDARLAVTHFRVVASKEPDNTTGGSGYSLLQVRLETGRKNQIRIHMADLHHPLAGDHRFGATTDPLNRLGLHAAELGFRHPATGMTVRYSSPAPASFWRAAGASPPPVAREEEAPAVALRPAPGARAGASPGGRLDTSWDRVAEWYDEHLADRGSDNYERIILPGALRLLRPAAGMRILDVACGQGILARRLWELGAHVVGIDASPRLIEAARRRIAEHGERSEPTGPADAAAPLPDFRIADARDLASLGLSDFDAAACIMALANIDPLEPIFRGIASALRPGGAFVAIIAHPAFRAPGQTSWGWDPRGRAAERRARPEDARGSTREGPLSARDSRRERPRQWSRDREVEREGEGEAEGEGGCQYRRVEGYLSPGQHPIQMHPGSAPDVVTWTFHRPIQTYVKAITDAGLLIESVEEWPAQRLSTSGPRAAEENRARREIPLFLGIRAVKGRSPT